MNYTDIERKIENQISKFSNINFRLNDYTLKYTNRYYRIIVLIHINTNGVREEYNLDVETFEVIEQVE